MAADTDRVERERDWFTIRPRSGKVRRTARAEGGGIGAVAIKYMYYLRVKWLSEMRDDWTAERRYFYARRTSYQSIMSINVNREGITTTM